MFTCFSLLESPQEESLVKALEFCRATGSEPRICSDQSLISFLRCPCNPVAKNDSLLLCTEFNL